MNDGMALFRERWDNANMRKDLLGINFDILFS